MRDDLLDAASRAATVERDMSTRDYLGPVGVAYDATREDER